MDTPISRWYERRPPEPAATKPGTHSGACPLGAGPRAIFLQPRPPHWECGTQNWTGPRCHEGWNDGFHQILPKSTVHPRRCTEDVSSDHDGRPVQMFDCKGMSFAVRPAQGPSSKCGLRKGAKQSDGSSPVVHPVLRRATPNSLLEFPAGWFLVGSYE